LPISHVYHTTAYYGGTYSTYHPPTTVNYYYGTSCGNCGGWSTGAAAATGMAVGMVAGASMASSQANAAAASSANAYNAGYVAGSNNATASSAYNAGYVAGSTNAAGTPATYTMGAIYATLPSGCMVPSGFSTTYYLCGNTWFQPSYGANGVYYRVVPTP
jgi:hypothetical protein